MNDKQPTISVVIPCAGKSSRFDRLMQVVESIVEQDCNVIEILLVWQGGPRSDFLSTLPMAVNVIFEPVMAIANARNIGAEKAIGDWLLFLDDDTTLHQHDLISRTITEVDREKADYAIASVFTTGKVLLSNPVEENLKITKHNLQGNHLEPGLLIPRAIFVNYKYNSCLGIGCLHGASEGFDLGARLIKAGYQGVRLKNYTINHPELSENPEAVMKRMFLYSLGNGKALVMNKYYYRYFRSIAKSLIMMIKNLLLLRWFDLQAETVRILCLVLGPLIPLYPPFTAHLRDK